MTKSHLNYSASVRHIMAFCKTLKFKIFKDITETVIKNHIKR